MGALQESQLQASAVDWFFILWALICTRSSATRMAVLLQSLRQTQLAVPLYKSFSAGVDHACLRELHWHSYTGGRCSSRQEVGYRHEWPLFVELPAFKNQVLCWLRHLQRVLPAHCTSMPHQIALASFILTNVDVCGYGEVNMWQSLCCVPPPAPRWFCHPRRTVPPSQPFRRWVHCFLGPRLLSHNSA